MQDGLPGGQVIVATWRLSIGLLASPVLGSRAGEAPTGEAYQVLSPGELHPGVGRASAPVAVDGALSVVAQDVGHGHGRLAGTIMHNPSLGVQVERLEPAGRERGHGLERRRRSTRPWWTARPTTRT